MKTLSLAKKLRTIITPDQFDELYTALPSDTARLMAEVPIESGLRWAELIELRPADLIQRMQMLTVSRVAVEVVAKFHQTLDESFAPTPAAAPTPVTSDVPAAPSTQRQPQPQPVS